MTMYGSIEGGGTKFVCAVGNTPDDIVSELTIPTTTPDETLARVVSFFTEHGPLDAIGLAMFGPIDLDHASPTYGYVTSTPKPGWSGTDVVGRLESALDVPVGFDTDVNGAALGEGRWGAAQGLDTFIYITVGTGVGGGGVVNGEPLHGLVHPEIGHMRIPRFPGDNFAGTCRYHGDCLEGLVCGPAIAARWGRPAQELGDDTARAVELAGHNLGHAMANLVVTVSPQLIIIGGGVAKLPGLIEATRERVLESLAGYVQSAELENGAIDFLVRPGLGDRAGIAGGFVLAERAVSHRRR
ncbi:MAG: ROK family protein [Actinomycetota bacterium]